MPASPSFYGVINPYRLVELTLGTPIDWNKVKDHRTMIEEVLGRRLFDILYSPVRPNILQGIPASNLPEVLQEWVQPPHEEKKSKYFDIELPFATTIHESYVEYENLNQSLQDEDIEGVDVLQGYLADCYLLAVIAALEWASPGYCTNKLLKDGIPSVQPSLSLPEYKVCIWDNGTCNQVSVAASQYVIYSVRTREAFETVETASGPLKVKRKKRTVKRIFPFAHSIDPEECWPSIIEKGYACHEQHCSSREPDWDQVGSGRPGLALERLTEGGFTIEYFPDVPLGSEVPLAKYIHTGSNNGYLTPDEVWDFIRSHCYKIERPFSENASNNWIGSWKRWLEQHWTEEMEIVEGQILEEGLSGENKRTTQFNCCYPMVAGPIPYQEGGYPPEIEDMYDSINIIPGHMYSVLGLLEIGSEMSPSIKKERYVILRNPWGFTEPKGKLSELGLVAILSRPDPHADVVIDKMNNDGLFALSIKEFMHYYYQIWTLKNDKQFVSEENSNRSELLLFH